MYTSNSLSKHESLLFFALLLFGFVSSPLNASIKVSDNFESGNLNGLKCSGNCPNISTSAVSSRSLGNKNGGKHLAKFILTRKMKTGYRTEVTIPEKGNFDFGKEYWIGMDYLYKDWATDPEPEMAPFQVHSKPSAWTSKCRLHSAHNTAPFLMSSQSGKVSFLTYGRKKLWTGSIQKNQWLNIIVHFKISAGSDGFVEAWKDGVKLGRVNGPNSPKNDNCGKPMRSPFFKMGIYKSIWKDKATVATRRELWIDNLKIIDGANGSSLVNAGSVLASKPVAAKAPAPKPVAAKAPAPKPVAANKTTAKPISTRSSNSFIKKKLVAHWLMDSATGKSIVDRSGYGHPGTLVNGAKVIADEGVKFDGVDDYVNVGKLNIAGDAVTVGAWFWANDLSDCDGNGCRIISKATGVSEQDHDFMISTIKSGSKTRLRFRLKTNGKTSTLTATSGNISRDEWVHVAASYDGERMRLYKDGIEVGSKAKQGSITNSNSLVWIGDNPPNAGSRSWKGNIGDVRVYNYAMTGSDVSDLASVDIAAPVKNDVEAPKINNMKVDVTNTTAVITWDTSEASDSLVGYGLTKSYGEYNDKSDLFVTNHKVTLKNLDPGEVYHYRVRTKDNSGNVTSSDDLTFAIAGAATGDNLVAHWQGDVGTKTTVFDSSGNGFVGNLKNGAKLLPDEGVKLDGINDYMDLGKLDVAGDSVTVGAWFWSDDLSNCKARDCRIISKATGIEEQDHYFMVSTIKVGSKTRLRFRLKTNGNTSTLIAKSGDIYRDEWFHVAASYDGEKMRLYKDGIEVGSMSKKGNITNNKNASAWIGDNPPRVGTRPWKGNIGDVRVYDYPMTNSEVFKLVR